MICQSTKRTFRQIWEAAWRYEGEILTYSGGIPAYSHVTKTLFFDEAKYIEVKKYLELSQTFLELRCLMMMLVVPKRIHKKDHHQAAFLSATISRVSSMIFLF